MIFSKINFKLRLLLNTFELKGETAYNFFKLYQHYNYGKQNITVQPVNKGTKAPKQAATPTPEIIQLQDVRSIRMPIIGVILVILIVIVAALFYYCCRQ